MKIKLILVFLIFIHAEYSLNAQTFSTEVIASSGNEVFGEEAVLSWTIGENFIDIFDGNSGIQTLGFHQTYSNHQEKINLSEEIIKFYPNPVYDMLYIQSEKPMNDVVIQVFSITGELVMTKTVDISDTYRLNLSKLKNGVYHFRLNHKINLNYKFVKLNN